MEKVFLPRKQHYDTAVSCAFTGNRPQKLPWHYDENDAMCLAAKAKLFKVCESLITNKNLLGEGISHFLCGMALGADCYFAETILKLKEKYPFVTLEACLPCPEYEQLWDVRHKDNYKHILSRCDQISVIKSHYDAYANHARNRYMVDFSDTLICLCYEQGGAQGTIRYAEQKGKNIIDSKP